MDINVVIDEKRFNYRVAAFIVCGDYVLLQKNDKVDFWNMLGGRAHICESSEDAIKRELKEELNLEVDVLSLVYVSENFFPWQGVDVHEIEMVYKVEVGEEYLDKFDNFAVIDGHGETTKWFKKDEIKNLKCLPVFIYNLAKDCSGLQHAIIHD